jgi:hypothetical protein
VSTSVNKEMWVKLRVMIGRPWPPACCDEHRREQGNQDRNPLERADRIGTEIHQAPPSAHGSKFATARRPTTRPAMKRSTDSVSPRILGAGYAPPVRAPGSGWAYTSSVRPATFTIQYT